MYLDILGAKDHIDRLPFGPHDATLVPPQSVDANGQVRPVSGVRESSVVDVVAWCRLGDPHKKESGPSGPWKTESDSRSTRRFGFSDAGDAQNDAKDVSCLSFLSAGW